MKKKIIIFNSNGGGGHITVTKALEAYLGDEYTIKSISTLDTLLKPVDPVHILTFGRHTAEEAYNYFIHNKAYQLLNFSSVIAFWYFRLRKKRINWLALTYLKNEKPDLVISVAPFFNGALLYAAQQLNIPFLLIPTDLDITIYMYGITSSQYNKFRLALAFDDKDIAKQVRSLFKPEQIVITGFPLRPSFFEQKNISLIKETLQIPDQKPIILVLMGFQGSTTLHRFAQQLMGLPTPAHIIFCLGKSEKLHHKIKSLPFPAHLSTTVIGFTPNIADLMFIADLIITKSGSVSFCEALYANKYILLDATSSILKWEQFNHYFVKKYGRGMSIEKEDSLIHLVNSSLRPERKTESLHLDTQNACNNIKNLVNDLIQIS